MVGAGASKEFGLPTGEELKTRISELLKINTYENDRRQSFADQGFMRAASSILGSTKPLYIEAPNIRANMPFAPSIDNYLDTHRNNETIVSIGKLAIARVILNAENESRLNVYRNNKGVFKNELAKLSGTWIAEFFRLLVSETDLKSFKNALREITFISFNYDRCLQQFFSYTSKSYFNLDDEGTQEVLDCLDIIYPYGNVGDFRWTAYGDTNFGGMGLDSLVSSTESLRTFTEGCVEGVPQRIFDAFSNAKIAVFLGFGFLPLNMTMLHSRGKFKFQRVLGTVFGESKDSQKVIRNQISKHFKDTNGGNLPTSNLHLEDLTCNEFIAAYRRRLSVV